jgi:cell division protein FtsW (lipid II flippase)
VCATTLCFIALPGCLFSELFGFYGALFFFTLYALLFFFLFSFARKGNNTKKKKSVVPALIKQLR